MGGFDFSRRLFLGFGLHHLHQNNRIDKSVPFNVDDVDDVDEKVNFSGSQSESARELFLGFGLHHLHQNNRIE